jgi:Mrp family chromosome partitioning ATPase
MQHIRSMLQLRPTDSTRIVAITSPSAGAGKTTIGFALGLSFAAAGSRTLLIDSDFCGHGMTSAMRSIIVGGVGFSRDGTTATATDSSTTQGGPVASILAARRPRGDDATLEESSDAAAKPATDAVESTVPAGTKFAALARRRLSDGHNSRTGTGILDALDGIPLERCVVETGIDGLSLLPVGDARAADVDRLTPSAYRRLLAECRERYDAVIIDTGPVLGSIEAAFATAAADDVVVVLPRGELRSVAEAALQRLRQVGVRIAGVVFNRALVTDVTHSNYSSKSVSVAAEAA